MCGFKCNMVYQKIAHHRKSFVIKQICMHKYMVLSKKKKKKKPGANYFHGAKRVLQGN